MHVINYIIITLPKKIYHFLLRAKAECFACLCHRLGVRPSVHPSVRLSHSWAVSKRCKL